MPCQVVDTLAASTLGSMKVRCEKLMNSSVRCGADWMMTTALLSNFILCNLTEHEFGLQDRPFRSAHRIRSIQDVASSFAGPSKPCTCMTCSKSYLFSDLIAL